MNIGIVSFAHMHAFSYAQAILKSKEIHLIGIYDDDENRGRRAAEQFETPYFNSYDELLNQDVDAIIVTSENAKHCKHVITAAKAGKHVLCEKPISTNLEDAQKMIDACNENGVKLQIAFPVRFNSGVVQAKDLIDRGEIGKIIAMRGTNRGVNPGGWFVDPDEAGGGAIMDHTVHVVDIMRWFLNAEVTEVYAEIDQLFTKESLDTPIDDAGIITMELENGVFGILDGSWSRNKTYPNDGDVTLEIVGTKGTLSIDAFGENIHVTSDDKGTKDYFWGGNMNERLINDFTETVSKNREPFITGGDGFKALEVTLAAYNSAENNVPVKI